jgi:hypothetical protein
MDGRQVYDFHVVVKLGEAVSSGAFNLSAVGRSTIEQLAEPIAT